MLNQKHCLIITLFSLLCDHLLAQDRLIQISPTFEWVDEKEQQTVHSFEGGGSKYSYQILVNKKVAIIDSVVVWVDGKREMQEGQTLDENGKGKFLIPERADTIWFYAKKKMVVFYYYPEIQYMVKGFNLFFIENPHTMIRSGVVNLPFSIGDYQYVLMRDYGKSGNNDQWEKTIATWTKQYGSIILSSDNRSVVLYFMGVTESKKNTILTTLSAHPSVAHISVQLDNIISNSVTHFIQSDLSIYTEADPEKVKEMAVKFGFSSEINRSGGKHYILRYTRSKMLNRQYISDSQKLLESLGAKSASHQFYSEVRLD
jgi:hypothetical protein